MRARRTELRTATPVLGANPLGQYRRSRFCQLVLGVLVAGWVLTGHGTLAAVEGTDDLFEQYEINTGSAKRQTILPGFFLGGATAEIAVLYRDEGADLRVRMYGFGDDTWAPVLEGVLGPEVLFVDVANIDGRDRLISYQSGRLNWFDPDSATQAALVELPASYNATSTSAQYSGAEPLGPSHNGEIPHIDITRDLNRDGRDDLVMPAVDGFWISTQASDGAFNEPRKFGPPEPFRDETAFGDERAYGEAGVTALTIPWYLSRVHEMDYDRDGRSDLVFWNEDHFEVHRQDARGLFSPMAETFTTDVPFDSDGAYSLIFGFGDASAFSLLVGTRARTKQTVLHSLRDMNGDGVADLLTLSLEGRSMLRQRSVYKVYFGAPTSDGTLFSRDAVIAIEPRRKGPMAVHGYSSQALQDFDSDGRVDLMLRSVRMGPGGMFRALVGNSVALNLEFYRMKDGLYPDEPTTSRRIRRFAPFAGLGNVFFPPVLMGDVNGDGRADLLAGQSPEELHVFVGEPGRGLLAREPRRIALALPPDERNTWLADLNRDGKQDLLVHHTPTDRAPTEPHRLVVLIAR